MSGQLKTVERLFVSTSLGEREIELCFGDITGLEESVDFILVSAFQGDYAPMRGTVIGALWHKLGIKVANLAKDKQEDLRQQFNCWISKNINSTSKYGQLICFESRKMEKMEAVKEIFRAMMPAFNNTNKSVITPLLATGHQHVDEKSMMVTMVKTAARWMWLGMPLQKFKIVIYCRDVSAIDTSTHELVSEFRSVKKKIEYFKRIPKEPQVILDIFIMFCEEDAEYVKEFNKYMKKYKKNLAILTIKDVTMKENSWQHDLSQVLLTVARVVPVLTSHFLGEGSCIDQFNVALCCNRRTKRHLLAPVLMERTSLPVYMNMVQWVNCRDNTAEQYEEAANTIISQIHTSSQPTHTQYDVFISYAHKNITTAKLLLEQLEKLYPKPQIFFDYDELTTGVAWQQKLYSSIDNARCVLALISPEYQASAVCQEELNIALARHFSNDKTLELVPLYITDSEDENINRYLRPVRLADKSFPDICTALGDWLTTGNTPDIFSPIMESLDIAQDLAVIREDFFKKYYVYRDGELGLVTPAVVQTHDELTPCTTCDVYISHSVRDQKYATFLVEYLKSKQLKAFCKSTMTENEASLINEARCIVVLLSQSYINSTSEVEQFNVILSRERQSKNGRLLYVIKTSDWTKGPTYMSLVPCDTSLMDDYWWQFSMDHRDVWYTHQGVLDRVQKKVSPGLIQGELCPLLKAACDILAIVRDGRYLANVTHHYVILHNIIDVHHDANVHAESQPQQRSSSDTPTAHSSVIVEQMMDDTISDDTQDEDLPMGPDGIPVPPPLPPLPTPPPLPPHSSTSSSFPPCSSPSTSSPLHPEDMHNPELNPVINGKKDLEATENKTPGEMQEKQQTKPAEESENEPKRRTKSRSCILL